MKHDQLFNAITGVLPTLPGWCELDKAHALAAAVLTLRPRVCAEIGVFGGGSLIPTALACQAVGSGHVVAIDPWSAAASTEGYEGPNKEWWSKLDHEAIYQCFGRNVQTLGLTDRVLIQRAKSDDVTPADVIDLLHVDGQHTDQAVRDVQRFAPKIRNGGLCFMDDIGWVNETTGAGVQRAVEALLKLGFVELYKIGTGACFQRVK